MTFKRLLLASALALPIVLSAGQAKADPISAAIVTAIGLTGTAAAVATFVINTTLYAAGSWAISKVTQSGKQGLQERQAAVTSLSLGETPREMIVGTACTGGTLIDAFYFGGKYGTDTVTRGIALCDHEVDALVGYYVDDKYYPFTTEGIQPGFNGQLSIEFKNARSEGWLAPLHVRTNGGWTTTDRLCGVTHVWVDTRVDDKVWTQGHPKLKFVVRGLKCYDPRKDTAFGYTGANPHDPDDPSTWEYSDNPQIQRYAYQRGVYATGHHGEPEHLLFGRGLSAIEAPPERIIAHANVCDELIGSRRRYTSHGVISASQSHVEVEDMFAAAMAGVVVQREGGLEIEPGQAKAVVKTITDLDLVTGRPVKFSEFSGDNEGGRINTVVPRYIEPSQHYKDHSGPVARVYADVIADSGPRETTLPLALVTNVDQAYDCAEITRRLARLERRATITLPPGFAELEEGDWIAWQSDRYHDGATVRYRIETWELDEGWRQTVTLREIASSVFGVPDPVEDKASPPPAPVPVDALSLSSVTAEAITIGTADATLPAIRVAWNVADADPALLGVRAEVRKSGETDVAHTRTEAVADGQMVITNGVGPNLSLQVRLVPIAGPTRPVVPSSWISVSTGTIKAGDVVSTAPSLVALDERIDDAFGATAAVAGDLAAAELVVEATQAELVAARQGSPNLSANITGIKTTVETEAMTRASEINRVEAKTGIRNNLVPNSTGVRGGAGWVLSGGWFAGDLGWAWGHGFKITTPGTAYMYTDPAALIEWPANTKGVLSFDALMLGRTAGRLRIYVQWHTPTGTLTSDFVYIEEDRDFGERLSLPVESPATNTHAYIVANTEDFAGSQVAIRQIKLERGLLPATAWTDDATEASVAASVTQHSQAIYDLEGKAALAEWQVKTDATGGKPAVLRLVSSSVGSGVIIDGEFLYFGPNTTLDPATNTLQTLVGSNRRVLALGAPIGASGDIVEWWGPASEPLSNMSRLNGFNGRMTVAPYVFDNVSGQSFAVKCSHTVVAASRVGAGTVTSPVVTFEVSGAVGPVQFDVYLMNGDGSITAVNPSASDATAPFQHQTVFSTSVTVTQIKTARFICSARDANGNTGTAVVAVSLRENT